MEPSKRKTNTSICLPIAYGSIAWQLTNKKITDPPDPCTHQWCLYVRHPNGHDLGHVVKKVVFHLHPSFLNATREVSDNPYEVQEKGWGEFDAGIELHFRDPVEKPVTARHFLKLFHGVNPPPPSATVKQQKPVVVEFYDEVVFTDPSVEFANLLNSIGTTRVPRHTLQDLFPLYNDAEDVKRIESARDFVRDQLRVAKNKLLRLESEAKEVQAQRQPQQAS